MAEVKNTSSQRLTKIKDFLTFQKTATTIPWDPDCTIFPTRKELPTIPGAPPEAAWCWGDNDYVSIPQEPGKAKSSDANANAERRLAD